MLSTRGPSRSGARSFLDCEPAGFEYSPVHEVLIEPSGAKAKPEAYVFQPATAVALLHVLEDFASHGS